MCVILWLLCFVCLVAFFCFFVFFFGLPINFHAHLPLRKALGCLAPESRSENRNVQAISQQAKEKGIKYWIIFVYILTKRDFFNHISGVVWLASSFSSDRLLDLI